MRMLHVTIQTEKFESEIEFYKNMVGLTLQRGMRPTKDLVFLANGAGETCVEVIRILGAEDADNDNLSIGFMTEDVEKKRKDLVAAGYEVTPMISPMPDVKFFFVKDPAGVRVVHRQKIDYKSSKDERDNLFFGMSIQSIA